MKLVRAGVLQQDIIDILAANSRVPQSNWGDLNGQLNALDLGERRLHALLDEYGDETIAAALAALSGAPKADARQYCGAAGRHLRLRRLSRHDGVTDAASHRARSHHRGRPHAARLLALGAAVRRPAQHRTLDHRRVLLRCAQAPVHRRARQRGLPRADRFVIPDTTLLGVSAPRPVGGTPRLSCASSTSFSAPSPRPRQSAPKAARSPPSTRFRSPAGARGEHGSCSAFSAAGLAATRRATGSITATIRSRPPPSRRSNPGVALSDHFHAMGAAAGFRWSRPASRRARRDLRDRSAGRGRRRGLPPR